MHHKYPYIIVILILIGSIYLVLFRDNPNPENNAQNRTVTPTEQPNFEDYTASFLIFTNGTKRIFTSRMYHNLSKDVYIQNPDPSIITVKKQGTTWQDFFSSLPMGLSSKCLTTGTGQTFCDGENGELNFILNGIESPEVLEQEIQPFDKFLVSFGRESDIQLQQQYNQIQSPQSTHSAQFQSGE